jgi:hypothetical protein
MQLVTADDKQCIKLPGAKPGQVFAMEVQEGSDAITLTPLVNGKPWERPFDPHMYDNYPQELIDLENASANVDMSSEEPDRQ